MAVLFTITRIWKLPKCPSIHDWIIQWNITQLLKKILPFAIWMVIEGMMQSEVSRMRKINIICIISWKARYQNKMPTGLSNRTNLGRIWNSLIWVLDFFCISRNSREHSTTAFFQFPLISLNCLFVFWVRGEKCWEMIMYTNSPKSLRAQWGNICREVMETALNLLLLNTAQSAHFSI